MKKSMALVFGALLLAVCAQAAVVVKQGQKTTKYENGYVVRLTDGQAAEVDYDGVKISVPQGVKVLIRQNKDGSVRVTGKDMQGVKVNDQTFSASGMASFSVTRAGVVSVQRGTVMMLSSNGQVSSVKAGGDSQSSSTQAAAAEAETPVFVNEALQPSTVAQQAVQNVTEDKVLSPSAPR